MSGLHADLVAAATEVMASGEGSVALAALVLLADHHHRTDRHRFRPVVDREQVLGVFGDFVKETCQCGAKRATSGTVWFG